MNFDNRLRVCGGDSSEKIRAIEVSGVEEVGRYALGFQLEAAEFEDPTIDGCMEEFGLVLGKGGGRHGECEEKSFEGDLGVFGPPRPDNKGSSSEIELLSISIWYNQRFVFRRGVLEDDTL
jgi:hypothetical protein